MLFAVAHKGKKIIVNRNAHKSVFNACEVMKIEPVVLNQNVIEGVMVPPSADDVEKTLEEHPDAIGVLLTYPDYYGVAFDLKKVAEAVKRAKKVLLIDGAHGDSERREHRLSRRRGGQRQPLPHHQPELSHHGFRRICGKVHERERQGGFHEAAGRTHPDEAAPLQCGL